MSERDDGMPSKVFTGRGGALRGLNVKRWLYIEPFFKVVLTWPRRTIISELLDSVLRGEKDMRRIAYACRDAPESTVVLNVKLTADMLQACPRSLDYWLEDFNRVTDEIARQTAGGTSATAFYREVLEADPPYHFIGVTTGKGRDAPTLDNQIQMDMPPQRAKGRISPTQRVKPRATKKPTTKPRSHK